MKYKLVKIDEFQHMQLKLINNGANIFIFYIPKETSCTFVSCFPRRIIISKSLIFFINMLNETEYGLKAIATKTEPQGFEPQTFGIVH